MADLLSVEVAYALPQRQDVVNLKLPEGSTLQQAVEASGLLQKYADIDLKKNKGDAARGRHLAAIAHRQPDQRQPPHPTNLASARVHSSLQPRHS